MGRGGQIIVAPGGNGILLTDPGSVTGTLDLGGLPISGTLDVRQLTQIQGLALDGLQLSRLLCSGLAACTSLDCASSLLDVSATALDVSGMSALASLDVHGNGYLTTLSGLAACKDSLATFLAFGCDALTYGDGFVRFTPSGTDWQSLLIVRLDDCNLAADEVDAVLADFNAIGASNGSLNVGGNNAAPSNGEFNEDYVALVGRGWTVTISA